MAVSYSGHIVLPLRTSTIAAQYKESKQVSIAFIVEPKSKA